MIHLEGSSLKCKLYNGRDKYSAGAPTQDSPELQSIYPGCEVINANRMMVNFTSDTWYTCMRILPFFLRCCVRMSSKFYNGALTFISTVQPLCINPHLRHRPNFCISESFLKLQCESSFLVNFIPAQTVSKHLYLGFKPKVFVYINF